MDNMYKVIFDKTYPLARKLLMCKLINIVNDKKIEYSSLHQLFPQSLLKNQKCMQIYIRLYTHTCTYVHTQTCIHILNHSY